MSVAQEWSLSMVRRGVVFGASLRVPLSLLLADVLTLYAVTPEPPAKGDTLDTTAHILKATTTQESKAETKKQPPPPPAPLVSQGLTRCGAALRFGVHALWGVGGAVVFRELCLPLLIPALLPHLKLAVGGVDQWLLLSDMDKNSDGGSSLNAGGAVDWFASQRHGSEATEAQAQAQASLAALASSMALASVSGQRVYHALTAVDRDTCSFLFLVFSAQFTAVAGLLGSKSCWRALLAAPACLVLPPALAAMLACGCNGLLGGLHPGADPAACLATLLFALGYHLVAASVVSFFVPPYP